MIIYYKLPSYSTSTASEPFTKISAMRRRGLKKNFVLGMSVLYDQSKFRSGNGAKPNSKYAMRDRNVVCWTTSCNSCQTSLYVQALMNNCIGYFPALGGRVHSDRRKDVSNFDCILFAREAFQKLDKIGTGISENCVGSIPCTCPIYIKYVSLCAFNIHKFNNCNTKDKTTVFLNSSQ